MEKLGVFLVALVFKIWSRCKLVIVAALFALMNGTKIEGYSGSCCSVWMEDKGS